jgi:hypothetical protein
MHAHTHTRTHARARSLGFLLLWRGADHVSHVAVHGTLREPVVDLRHDSEHDVVEAVLLVLEEDDGQRAVGEDGVRIAGHGWAEYQRPICDAALRNRISHIIIVGRPPCRLLTARKKWS